MKSKNFQKTRTVTNKIILITLLLITGIFPDRSFCQYTGGPGDGFATRKTNGYVILPVEILSFYSICSENNIKICWKTLSEINNDFFTIERSHDAVNWTFVKRVEGSGNSNTVRDYSVNDIPEEGILYYRLKQTDFDGKYKYCGITTANCKAVASPSLIIYPNPADDFIEYSLSDGICNINRIRIVDCMGHTCTDFSIQAAENLIQPSINISYLPAGLYSFILETVDGERYCKSFIKNRT